MHASGQSVRAIAAAVGVSKSLVANIVSPAPPKRLAASPSFPSRKPLISGGWDSGHLFSHNHLFLGNGIKSSAGPGSLQIDHTCPVRM